ncbi:unnamed protein product [Anisakis simplex]|uniref:Probable splicing factor, arginine/serine-rich 6 (inferred by orthology to a C. elegans protein) n=1 Tax=Anisakis simplex TaxID=6269 RepID=A0A0M3JX18_ANISI|nr:unnamed protein product [Anisakis simplex]
MSRRGDPLDCKVYVGGLPQDATSQEVEDAFNRFGRIRKVWVARRPPGFAFVEFEDSRDAEDSVRALDGTRICGARARVELSHGRRRNPGGYGGRGGYGGGGGGGGGGAPRRRSRSPYRARSRSRSRTPPARRSSPRYEADRRGYSRSLSR